MKRKAQLRKPPAQKAVNELWTVLGAHSNAEALTHAQEIIEAAQSEPLFLTVVMNRATGALIVRHNVRTEWGEAGIRQLREALRQIDESLVANLATLAEARGQQRAAKTPASGPQADAGDLGQ